MEISFRSVRLISRLLRKPVGISRRYRSVNYAAAKEDVNTELLNAFNRDTKAGGAVPVFRRALLFPTRVALQDEVGIYTYAGLHQAASTLSKEIAAQLVGESERTIAYMCSNDASHVIVQWAIWMTGNIAVPLTSLHPAEMLKYFLTDSGASLVVCTQDYDKLLRPITLELSKPLLVTGKDKEITAQLYQPDSAFLKPKPEANTLTDVGKDNSWYGSADAMLIYTSGTTSKPKGVVWTHSMLGAQIAALHAAWRYSADDVVLHALPLHHIHGQLNSLNASLAAGARIRMLPQFISHVVWARLLGMGERDDGKVTVFHGVPAMYARLAADHAAMFRDKRTAEYVRNTLARMRLMCAGSAPLPATLFNTWEEISGIRLLERYGMSEAGMALSNPYQPAGRSVGCVGGPLPGTRARVAALEGGELVPLVTVESPGPDTAISLELLGLAPKKGEAVPAWEPPVVTVHKPSADDTYQGELLLKGPGVFTRYWNRAPKLDNPDFTADGWFRTGDTALYADGRFRILGRTSIDIIKTGGYKVSALQVESAILEHPNVADAAVLGVQDEALGEIVAAVVVAKDKPSLTLKDLKEDVGKRLAPYQIPRVLVVVEQMPRNVMGKLDKKVIREKFGDQLKLKK